MIRLQKYYAKWCQGALNDQIANRAQESSFGLAIQVMVYGFLTLLTLVSLANIVNHIFANLLQDGVVWRCCKAWG